MHINPIFRIPHSALRTLSLGIACIIVIALLGFTFPEPPQKDRLVWPLPPDEPKIAYVMSIETLKDVGVKKSIFKRIVEFVVGKEPEPRIQRPFGVLSDGNGAVYVTDTGLQTVHVFDLKNKKYRQVFKLENEPAPSRLLSPLGVVLDDSGNLHVSDSILKKVFVFDKTGKHIHSIGGDGEFGRPTGLAIDTSRKKLYIADTVNHKIWVYDNNPPYPPFSKGGDLKNEGGTSDKKRLSSYGKRGKDNGEFNFPTHISTDAKGDLYVTDALNFRIQVFNPEGKFVTSIGKMGNTLGNFSKPKGISLDMEGHIYVVDNLYDTVQIFNRSGELLLNFGTHGGGNEGLWMPNGMYVDKDNYIFIADTYNERVQVFKYLP